MKSRVKSIFEFDKTGSPMNALVGWFLFTIRGKKNDVTSRANNIQIDMKLKCNINFIRTVYHIVHIPTPRLSTINNFHSISIQRLYAFKRVIFQFNY